MLHEVTASSLTAMSDSLTVCLAWLLAAAVTACRLHPRYLIGSANWPNTEPNLLCLACAVLL